MRFAIRLLTSIIGFAAFVLVSNNASALTITTYSDQSSFNAAAGATTLFDFNASTLGLFTSQDFGDFTLSESDPNANLNISSGGSLGNIDGTSFVRFDDNTQTLGLFTVSFDFGISAFGLDYVNNDGSSDFTLVTADGQTFAVGGPNSSGFFGFTISDGTVNSFFFQDDPGGGQALISANYDNFRYSPLLNPVPLPAALPLFGTGLGIMGFIGWRRKRRMAEAAVT